MSASPMLACALEKACFDPYDLVAALEINDYLFKLGFDEAIAPEKAEQCAYRLIDLNPERAYARFHGRHATWGGASWNDCETLRRADEYCIGLHADAMRNRLVEALNFEDPLCGAIMAERLEEMREKDFTSMFEVSPSEIARCFESGNAASQMKLHDFIKKLGYTRFMQGELMDAYVGWLKELEEELDRIELDSKIGPVRKRWVLEEIQSIVKNQE